MSERSARNAGLSIVAIHVALVASLGQYYAKLAPFDGVPIYPTEIAVVLAALLGGSAVSSVPWDRMTKVVVAFVGLGIAWVAIAGLGSLQGPGPKALSFFVYSVFYFVVRGAATDHAARARILNTIAYASVAAAILGFLHMQTGEPLINIAGGGATFEETTTGSIRWLPGEFALYASLGITISATDVILTRKLTSRSALLLAASAAELILAQHRSGFVAAALALVATAGFLSGSAEAIKGLLKLFAVATVGLVVFVWLFGGNYIDETMQRISHTGDMTDVNIEWRLLCWYEVFDGVMSQPLGHGFAHWDFVFTATDPLTGSHNSFLDLTYRIGVPGLLLLLAIPVAFVRQTRAAVQRTSALDHRVAVACCAGLLAFIVYASFNVVLETPHMSIFFWILLAVGVSSIAPPTAAHGRDQGTDHLAASR